MRKVTKIALSGVTGVLAIGVIASAASGSHNAAATSPAPQITHSAPAAPAPSHKAAPAPQASTPAAPQTQAPAAPAMTPSESQAVQSAQGYLSDGQGFSYYGLMQQLTSSSGEGFSQADATYALAHVTVDWNAQALESAKGYMSDGEGFSRDGLYQQLTSTSGEGFTAAQAQYAVNQVFASK